jgi:hypothetical protein
MFCGNAIRYCEQTHEIKALNGQQKKNQPLPSMASITTIHPSNCWEELLPVGKITHIPSSLRAYCLLFLLRQFNKLKAH